MKNDGGLAFPSNDWYRPGMSLRDYFAAAALTGLLTNDETTIEIMAKKAYQMADAMLEVRK